MILFAALEMQSRFQQLQAPPRLMPLGGVLTGFFGGLTGQQGAFRTMFLLKSGLEPARFIATGVLIAIIVDISRLPTYVASYSGSVFGQRELALIGTGTLCAFAGAFLGTRYLTRATVGVVRGMVAAMMLLIGIAMILGVVGS